uniref:Uncharacterized protein n=1 Tax=Pseudodiaptomus poplesia TaxID=213370 RepID=A0A1S6GL92_9MAXI|nr:hypothetical protein [Pseudodiaptomus poplesia]
MTVTTEQEIEMMTIDEAEGFGSNMTLDGNFTADNTTSVHLQEESNGSVVVTSFILLTINACLLTAVFKSYAERTIGQRDPTVP